MTRIAITVATFGALAIALLLGILWFAASPADQRWEPAVNTLALLAGLTGIFAERWAGARERRHQVLDALGHEAVRNAEVLADGRFVPATDGTPRVYPRLVLSAADTALISGALGARDRELFDLLHRWRDTVYEFNHRLDLTESLTFASNSAEDRIRFDQALHRDGGYLTSARALLDRLTDHLVEQGVSGVPSAGHRPSG